MFGKQEERLSKVRVVVTLAALAVALLVYIFRYFFGS
jgi:hypothetical protein